MFRPIILARLSILALFVALGLQGCSQAPETPFNNGSGGLSDIQKSPNDSREYRHIKLANKLDVLLISDPETEKSAASLDVYVGSYQNPKDREGLVHFLEHMLFLGTADYPNPGDYQTFISEHGGNHNAGTSLEHTTYFFDINADYLDEALDRFAPFFSSPNFDAKYVDRERNAVESEYRLKLKDDGRRQWDVLQEQIDPRHPGSKFTVGNLETLDDREGRSLRDELLAIYQRYYSANLMKLVVLGKENLDELEAMVVPRFELVPNTDAEVEVPIDQLIAAENLPLLIEVEPLKDVRELSLNFQLPPMASHWRVKPSNYLAGMIGHEGEASLLQVLKDRGWAQGLSASTGLQDRGSTLFSINIDLTPAGYVNRNQVIEMTFAWIQLFKGEGAPKWRYDEQAQMAEIAFRFQQKQEPMGYVSSLANNLQLYPAKDILRSSYIMEGYDGELVANMVNQLTPQNLHIMITAPEVTGDRKSMRYQTPYSAGKVDPKVTAAWVSPAQFDELRGPVVNPYIPQNLELATDDSKARVPAQLVDQPGLRAWHLLDTRFGVPKANIIASLGSDKTASIEGMAMAEMFVDVVRDQLNAKLYPATEAGLSFSLSVDDQGLAIVVGGYSDKQSVLLADIVGALQSPEWDEVRFEQLKQARLRKLSNFQREYPFRQVMSGMYSMLTGRWTPVQKSQALRQVSLAQVRDHAQGMLAELELAMMVSGNHTEQGAEAIVNQLSSVLKHKVVNNPSSIARIDQGALDAQIPIDHDDAVVVLYIQAANDSLEQRATFSLLGEMLSAPFYNSLRTEKQLGYVTAAFTSHLGPVPGMTMLVQSPVADEAQLRDEYQQFLSDYAETASAMTEDDLQRYKTSILGRLEESPKNLSELNGRYIESLGLGYMDFDFRQQLAEVIRGVTVAQLQQAYKEMVTGEPRALWIKTAEIGQANSASDLRINSQAYSYDF